MVPNNQTDGYAGAGLDPGNNYLMFIPKRGFGEIILTFLSSLGLNRYQETSLNVISNLGAEKNRIWKIMTKVSRKRKG